MTLLKQQYSWILERLIQVYLEKEEPVASQFLVMHCKLSLSPATIRNYFQELTKAGYLYKFHISSGRVPTDKAWNFFLQLLKKEGAIARWEREWEKKIKIDLKELQQWKKVVNYLAQQSHSLGFCYVPEIDELIQYGLKFVLRDILTNKKEQDYEVGRIIDSLDKLEETIKKLQVRETPLVLIGRRNPFFPSDNFSAILLRSPRSKYIIGLLGNKRMPYDRNIGLLKAIAKRG